MRFKLLHLSILISFIYLNSAYAQKWVNVNSFPNNDIVNTVGFSINGIGYTCAGLDTFAHNIGGKSYKLLHSYNPSTNTWGKQDTFPGVSRAAMVAVAMNGKGYAGLGYNGSSFLNDFYVYDPLLDNWDTLRNYPGSGTRHCFIGTAYGYIYVGGGGTSSGISNEFYVYDLFLDRWTKLNNLPFGSRASGVSFTINNDIYFGLGQTTTSDYNDLWKYDAKNDKWKKVDSLPGLSRLHAEAVIVGDKVLIGGGQRRGAGVPLNDFYEFDPKIDSFNITPIIAPKNISLYGTFSIGSNGYIIGGINGTTSRNKTASNDIWEIYYNTIGEIEFKEIPEFKIACSNSKIVYTSNANTHNEIIIYNIKGQKLVEGECFDGYFEQDVSSFNDRIFFYLLKGKDKIHSGKIISVY
jgi:N-acetylneuraminic acid mutarotase